MFDCTLINDEIDIFEMRLNILYKYVDKFIVVESNRTHSGKIKEFNIEKNWSRFKQFEGQIIYIKHQGVEVNENSKAWLNENTQRDQMLNALTKNAPADGMCFVSDVDEIPDPLKLFEASRLLNKTGMPVSMVMKHCMYYLNYACDIPFRGPFLYRPDEAQKIHKIFHNEVYTPTKFRCHMYAKGYENDFPAVFDAGWHFTTLGYIEEIKHKLGSFAHTEFNTNEFTSDEYLKSCIAVGKPYYKDVKFLFTKQPLSFLPEYVQQNKEKYSKYILE